MLHNKDEMTFPFLLLLLEDDKRRHDVFERWVAKHQPEARIVWARSAEAAIGVISRSGEYDFAGIMLDHDMDLTATRPANMNGLDVAEHILGRLDVHTPVLVHSMNHERAPFMVQALGHFNVLRIPFGDLEEEAFRLWLLNCREEWDERVEYVFEYDKRADRRATVRDVIGFT